MFSAIQSWGLPVENLLKTARITCQNLSTPTVFITTQSTQSRGKLAIIRTFSEVFQVTYTQAFMINSYLFKPLVMHISTNPITTTSMKGFKK